MSANGPLPIKSGASRLAGPCLTGLEWRAETLTLLLALFVVTYGALRQLHAHERSIWRVAGIQDRVCDYTRQSYQFVTESNVTDPTAWRFVSRDHGCPLDDLASAMATGSWPDAGNGHLRIMFQGDSVDRMLVEEFCVRAGTPKVLWPPGIKGNGYGKESTSCNSTSAFMLFTWVNAIHPDPPWRKGARPPAEGLEVGLRALANLTGGHGPDIVVLSSNFWDMADWLSKGDIPVGQDAPPVLSDHLLAYEVHLRQHIAVLRQAVPKTIFLAMHTYTRVSGFRLCLPDHEPWRVHPHLNAYMSQVNEVIRVVATDEGLPVVDYERIALLMPDAGGLFRVDGYHVQAAVQFNIMLNILLNEYAAQQLRHPRLPFSARR